MAYHSINMNRRQILELVGSGGAAAAAGMSVWPQRTFAADPLVYAFWPSGSEIVQEAAKRFSEQFNDTVQLEPIPGEYAAVLETKLAGGAPIDLFRAQRGQASRWHAAGWVRRINDLPGVDKILSEMFPGLVENSYAPNGDLLGLTYYNGGPFCLFRNEKVLSAAGYKATANPDDYPKTWEQVTEQARDIKKKGIVENPIVLAWSTEWVGLPWGLLCHGYSEGEYFVTPDLKATFSKDTPILKVLTTWKQWWDEGLVPHSLLSMTEAQITQTWAKGQHAFYPMLDIYSFLFNDPKQSVISQYNNQNPVMPGATHDTVLVGHALMCMTNRERSPADLTRVWELMKFFGWRDKNGDLWEKKQWAMLANLEVPFAEVYDDPEVKKKILGWMYPPLAEEEYKWLFAGRERAKAANILKAAWYEEWDKVMHDMISQEMLIQGSKTPEAVVTELRDLWDKLYEKYN